MGDSSDATRPLPPPPPPVGPPPPPSAPLQTTVPPPAPTFPSAPLTQAQPPRSGPRRRLAIAGIAVVVLASCALLVVRFVGASDPGASASPSPSPVAAATTSPLPSPSPPPSPTPRPTASPTVPPTDAPSASVDQEKVAVLLVKLQSNPRDVAILAALGDAYYEGSDFATAATFYDQILALQPNNVNALLARGAVAYNLGDLDAATQRWRRVVAIDASNIEAHYDLGFLCLNQAGPDWACVQREWDTVVRLDPNSDLGRSVREHLESLRQASMLPAAPAP